jgi:sec-independent protein translocase protein TatA
MNLGLPEILVILFLVLLLFGAKRLPELARGLGKSLSEFRKGVKDIAEDAEPHSKDDGKAG